MAFSDLYVLPTIADAKASVIAIAQAAGSNVTAFVLGEPTERWIEISARVIDAFTSTVVAQAVRGFFLDLATDPGDSGDLSADQTPRPGWLSALGEGWYGTTRRGQLFATGFVAVTNADTHPVTFFPYSLTFERTTAASGGGFPTYRNILDGSIYTNPDGSVTLAVGATAVLPVAADIIGTYSSAVPADIVTVVTQSFGTLTCTNAGSVLGSDGESAEQYRARCRLAADKLSPGGPGRAYQYAANTARDGTPLVLHDGTGLVSIVRTYVNADSATGAVTCYFADNDGPATATDVESANANIEGVGLGLITDPMGVVPDTVTYLGQTAIATAVIVTYTVKARAAAGVTSAIVKAAILQALTDYFATIEIGGYDQTAGAGTLYADEIKAVIAKAWPTIYHTTMSAPSADVALALGHVAVLTTPTGTETLV